LEVILLDWTRMGHTFCLGAAVRVEGQYRVVRPLLFANRLAPVRNVGWSPYLLAGNSRWSVFDLNGPVAAPAQPPHLEVVWVRGLRPCGRLADVAERRAILAATLSPDGDTGFGAALIASGIKAYLPPGVGVRSLTSILVPAERITFGLGRSIGAEQAKVRVRLPIPGLGERELPVIDHFLLERAEDAARSPQEEVGALQRLVRATGPRIVVRLGVSREFQGCCWLMADGFFSLDDPQP
jgi:hypothetical protein